DVQEDILRRLNALLDALRRERQRRQDGEAPPMQGGGGGTGEPRLVPLPAELEMLLSRQQYLREKHERFVERYPNLRDRSNMTRAQRRIYERLSREQGQNGDFLDELYRALFNESPQP